MRFILLAITLLFSLLLSAQMTFGPGDVRYGNEWLDYDEAYLRLELTETGVHRITNENLAQAGWNLAPENQDRWQLFHQGEQVPVYVTEAGIYFYGEKNDGALDRFLFANDADQLNPEYSIYNDTSAYFLRLTQVQGGEGQQTILAAGEAGDLSPEPYIFRQSQQIFNEFSVKSFIRITSQRLSIFYSHYDVAEGYGSRGSDDLLSFNGSTTSPFNLDLPGLALDGPQSQINVQFGVGFDAHEQVLVVADQELDTYTGGNWAVSQLAANFNATSPTLSGSLDGRAGDRDKAILASVTVDYPAQTTTSVGSGFHFRLAPGAATDRWISFPNAAAGNYLLFNLSENTVQREENAENGFRITDADANDLYYLLHASAGRAIPSLWSVTFPDLRFAGSEVDFLLLTSSRLRADGGGNDPVQEYAAYRRSPAGGGFRVGIVNVEDIYDQYSYGVERHPLGVRNYLARLRLLHPELRYLFMVGKGREYTKLRSEDDLAEAASTFFLPSFGLPASDNLLSADLDGVTPALSTGRLSVINADEIAVYLDKIQAYDAQLNNQQSLEEREWMKQIIHLGGGTTPGEQTSIRNLLRNMEQTIENSSFGANVNSWYKTSSEPIEESRQNSIFNRINEGSSIITFFGHSSSQGFDFSIDDPANYFNQGKTPLMLSLGCYSGDAFIGERSIGERFVLLADKGAIAFGASKGLGYITSLGSFANNYYSLAGGELYGQGIGDILRANVEDFSNNNNTSMRILTEQFSLNGDPAIRLHPQPGPDLVIDPASVRFLPRVVPAQQDSFTLKLRVVNIGRGQQDSVNLALQQQLPSGEVRNLRRLRIQAPNYDNELSFQLPNQGFEAVGLNTLLATIDSENELSESPSPTAEMNNRLESNARPGAPFYVVANTARPAYPPPYALHLGSERPELIASTTNPLASEQRYFLEVDSSHLFNSVLDRSEVTQIGGIIRWQPNVNWQDSTTYYWRISPDSVNTEGNGLIWNTSSFTYLTNNENPGWANAHQGQFNDGKFENIQPAANGQNWKFTRSINEIEIDNKVWESSDPPTFKFNGQVYSTNYPWFVRAGMNIIVVDSINNDDWYTNPPGGAYGTVSNNSPQDVFGYDTRSQQGRADMIDFLQNVVEDGKYVIMYTAQRGNEIDYGAADWITDSTTVGRTIFGILEEQGAELVRQINNIGSVPYTFVYHKGKGPIAEQLALSQADRANITFQIGFNWPEGEWTSAEAGPAQDWQQLDLSFYANEITNSDSARISLYGKTDAQAIGQLLLNENLDLDSGLDFNFSLTDISAEQYPYLYAQVELFDDETRTSPTIQQVYFHYTPTPDVAVDPARAFNSSLDSLEQGQDLEFEIGYTNISAQPMDSLLLSLEVSSEGGETESVVRRVAPLAPGEGGVVSFTITNPALSGNSQLQFRLNPGQDQREQIIFNNDLVQGYFFDRDRIDPLLNVFFDGVAIRDGDLVSSNPEILLEIRDENRFLLLNDTAAFQLNLRFPDGSSELIAFSDSRIEFVAATSGEDNQASIYFRPELTQDGLYEIRVQATDRTDNVTGRLDFVREFEVITEQRIANVFNYPNPFSTSTQFVYTLTGNELPEMFRIQIMTVSGRVVKDIDLTTEEALKIGTHRTQYTWDGTDEYGDELANGVYLYRVITQDSDGQTLKHHDNGTDAFFRNKMGKMVILR